MSEGEAPILVVDDDPSILSTVADILEFEGYSVECASSGEQALKLIDRRLPVLVLLDMRMPTMDGWHFARIIEQRGLRLPLVVMTAAQNGKQWAQEINADGYIAKPFDLTDLLDEVQRVRRSSKVG
jgi:two-component system OmpR family response regulator